jgi:hypothetical protein
MRINKSGEKAFNNSLAHSVAPFGRIFYEITLKDSVVSFDIAKITF